MLKSLFRRKSRTDTENEKDQKVKTAPAADSSKQLRNSPNGSDDRPDAANTKQNAESAKTLEDATLAQILAASDLETARTLIGGMADEKRCELVIAHKNLDIRRMLIESISDEGILQSLQKRFKGKNKVLFKAAKEGLKAARGEAQVQAQWQADYTSLQERLAQIPGTGISPQLPLTLQALEKKWQQLQAGADETQVQTIETLLKSAQAHIEAHRGELDELLTEAKAKSEFEAVISELDSAHETALENSNADAEASGEIVSELKDLIGNSVKRWERALRFAETSMEQAQQYQQRMHSLESLHLAHIALGQAADEVQRLLAIEPANLNAIEQKRLAGVLRKVKWPQTYPQPSSLIVLEERSVAAKARAKAQKEKDDATLKEVLKLKAIIDSQLKRGVLRPADRLYEKLQSKLAELPKVKQERLEKSIAKLEANLANLKDWKGFVTEPKKEKLLQEMAALVSFEGDIQERAERIKSLQVEWRDLKYDNQSDDDAVAKFKALADEAYAPCAVYFQEKRKIRAANLEAKEKICEELAQFCSSVDPKTISWEKISDIKKQAKADWKRIGTVENAKIKTMNKRFSQALDALDQVFEQALVDVLDDKKRLIEQAQSLLTLDNNSEAVEKAKRLQSQWSSQEKLPYSRERELWKQFRSHIDEIFATRQQLRSDQKAAEKRLDESAVALISDVEKLAGDAALLEKLGELDELTQQFNAIQFESPQQRTRLQKRFAKAKLSVEEHITKLRSEKVNQQLTEFRECLAALSKADAEFIEKGESAENTGQLVDSTPELPSQYAHCYQRRYAASERLRELGQTDQETFLQENQNKKAAICLELEILKGVETPEPWKAQRMARQVELLSGAMMADKQDAASQEAQVQDLLLNFFSLGYGHGDEELIARFQAAVSAS